ncbi:RNase P/RNase MRP complex subunit, partial [Coemansia sp. RSA 552]
MADSSNTTDFYAPLPKAIKTRSGAPTDVPVDPATRKFTQGFIRRTIDAAGSETKAQTTFMDRVDGRAVLLTNPYKDKATLPNRSGEAGIAKRAGRKRITAKEKRQTKIYDIPEESRRYELFLPLHRLWTKYIITLLGDKDISTEGADLKHQQILLGRIIKADLHGAKMSVERSKCPNFVGLSGIVAQETKNTFKLITEDD